MNDISIENKGKILMNLLTKTSINKLDNPQMISTIQYNLKQNIQSQLKQQRIININNDEKIAQKQYIYQEQLLELAINIYNQLFGDQSADKIISKFINNNTSKQIFDILVQKIQDQIQRLQEIEASQIRSLRLLQKSTKSGSNQQKWKIIVLNYRQKLQKYEKIIEQQKNVKYKLQKQLQDRMIDIQRLSNMNSIKHQKLIVVKEQLDAKVVEVEELNETLNEMELNLSTYKINNLKIQQNLVNTERQKIKLTQQLAEMNQTLQEMTQELKIQRERQFFNQKQNQLLNKQFNILQNEQQNINNQIQDLKKKHQYQLIKLQSKVHQFYIRNQQLQLQILQLQSQLQIYKGKIMVDSISQTQDNVVKAYYYNSLQDDLEGEYQPQEQHNYKQQPNDEQISEFELSLDPKSVNNHAINTPRQVQHFSDKDPQQINTSQYLNDNSFQQQKSMLSNATSRYMQNMQQMTAQLAEAYERINELTSYISRLQQQKKRWMKVQVEKGKGNVLGGYFTNFFKK